MKRAIQVEDLQQINSPESIAVLFSKLGYNADCQPLEVEDLELSTKSEEAIERAYLIANQGDSDLQVLLFQLYVRAWSFDGAAKSRMQAIAKSLCQRPTRFLLLATTDYRRLLLMSPAKSFDARMELKFSEKTHIFNPRKSGFSELIFFEKFAVPSLALLKLPAPSAFEDDLLEISVSETVHEKQNAAISYAQSQSPKSQKEKSRDSVGDYLKEIGRIRVLRADEEIELARKIKEILNQP